MSNVEYELVVQALDAARLKLGLDAIAMDAAADRVRLLINMTVKASQSGVFAAAVAMLCPPAGPTEPSAPAAGASEASSFPSAIP